MAGLFAWAADVVKRGNTSSDDDERQQNDKISLLFTPEQQKYYKELETKASNLSRSIQDLRLRLPPPDISQRLPHLHAHSVASSAALAAQLNAHSTTREQIQLREVKLQEENAAYEKAISDCRTKIQDKLQEEDLLKRKLEEMDATEKNLRAELENAKALQSIQSGESDNSKVELKNKTQADADAETAILNKLEEKKKELSSMEDIVQNLEKQWEKVQDKVLKQPSPAQREKILDKQLHSLIEQLETKQAQAEGLVGEIHVKENELERLNGLARRLETSNVDVNATRNRFGRSGSYKGSASSGYSIDPQLKPPFYIIGRTESQQRLMLLRSAFLLYVLVLHILVFIKISF